MNNRFKIFLFVLILVGGIIGTAAAIGETYGAYSQIKNAVDIDFLAGQWNIDVIGKLNEGNVFIDFKKDGTYRIYPKYDWDYPIPEGLFTVENGTVLIEPSKATNWPLYQDLFAGDKPLVVEWDDDYMYYKTKGVLKNGNVILCGYVSRKGQPVENGQVCMVEGIEVIRGGDYYYYALENLRMRSQPSTSAALAGRINYSFSISNYVDYNYVYKDDVPVQAASYNNLYCDLLLAGTGVIHIASTVKEETIDGITAPWYYVAIPLEQGEYYCWVFGGYLEMNDGDSQQKYMKLFRESALARNMLEVDEKMFQKYLETERDSYILRELDKMFALCDVIMEKGVVYHYPNDYSYNGNYCYIYSVSFTNTEVLSGSPFDVGKTRAEIEEILGPIELSDNSSFSEYNYNIDFDGGIYKLNLVFEDNVVIAINLAKDYYD